MPRKGCVILNVLEVSDLKKHLFKNQVCLSETYHQKYSKFPIMKQMKLDEASLTRQPEEVFDVLNKVGEGSYGSVYKAIHKESRQVLAIKQVPVDNEDPQIFKEISIMQECDSPNVVKYYGSYFTSTDLWIVMEYCEAGSVLDIMRLRGIYHRGASIYGVRTEGGRGVSQKKM